MDKVNQVTMLANTEVLKEPRGFIKILQVILAIFAFATTTAYNGSTTFSLRCLDNSTTNEISTSFSYTFRLDAWHHNQDCNKTDISMYNDRNVSSAAQFYVFVGVVAFLYCLGAVVLYVFAADKYHQNNLLPCVDLVVTVVFVLLWLISSSAWADGLSKVKHYTNPENLVNGTTFTFLYDEVPAIHVNVKQGGSYASLNVSIIFGFLNMVVWAGNIWFLYKETKWFGGESSAQQYQSSAGTPTDPQQRI